MRNFPYLGTVSAGTMRPEDLIPTFIDVLSDVLEWWTFQPGADAPERTARQGAVQSMLGDIERRADAPGYYDGEDADYDLEELYETLCEFAPDGFMFGAHPGDGVDYGFWQVDHEG